jgi:hypothetical protein
MSEMSEAEWISTQHQIFMLAGLIDKLQLKEFIRICRVGDAFGPFVDPTLYREKSKDIERVLNMALAIQELQTKSRRIMEVKS